MEGIALLRKEARFVRQNLQKRKMIPHAHPGNRFGIRLWTVVFLVLFELVGHLPAADPIRQVEKVRKMSREQAGARKPVLLRGVVTAAFPGEQSGFVLDDGTGGIYVGRRSSHDPLPKRWGIDGSLEAGMQIELEGVTTSGAFAPDIVPRVIRRVGEAPLPPARPVTMEDLLGGNHDCRRVRISGVVRRMDMRDGHRRIHLGTRGGKLTAFIMHLPEPGLGRLLDAEVEITGVAFSFVNERGELIGVNVQIWNEQDVKILEPPRETPDLASLHSVKPFTFAPPSLHRVRVRGTVTFARPGGFLYIQEDDRAVRVNTSGEHSFQPGDRVEVLGYPEMRNYFAEISDALVTKLGADPVPPAEEITRSRVLQRRGPDNTPIVTGLDGRRVALRGRLVKVETLPDDAQLLYLDCDGATVLVTMTQDKAASLGKPLKEGAEVRVSGVCVVELNTRWPAVDWARPINFHLLAQSPDEVEVLRAPPWWTPERIWIALGIVAALTSTAFIWVAVLRRQVNAQTEIIRQQSVRQTLAEERSRLARDLHDTLEQELIGISIQLDAAADSLPQHPAQAQHALESAHTLLSYTRTEARRSIWDLRGMALQEHGLLGALQWSADQLHGPEAPEIELASSGATRRLPAKVESNLLRIGTEGMTNAIKHARATLVKVELHFDPAEVTLAVTDNGSGFEAGFATAVSRGHFGLLGMRERATQMGGVFTLQSAPGKGTEILVRVPVNSTTVH